MHVLSVWHAGSQQDTINMSEGPHSSILRNTQKSEINRNASDWHRWSWLTRVTLTVGSSCCPPSLPPSCLTQLMSKLGSVQRSQCGAGENTMLSFFSFFGEAPHILDLWQTRHKSTLYKYIDDPFIYYNIAFQWNVTLCKVPSLAKGATYILPFHQLGQIIHITIIWSFYKSAYLRDWSVVEHKFTSLKMVCSQNKSLVDWKKCLVWV